MTRRRLQRLGQAVFLGAMLVGLTFPATRYAAMAVFVAGVALTLATIRPADRGSKP